MANTSSRTLRLLSLLQTRRFWPGEDLAGRLEVSTRTLRRDIDRLRELGYPVEAQRGIDGGYELAPGAVLPPLVLDDEEAVAIGVGLQAAVQGDTVIGIEEASVRALTKIVQVVPSRLRRRIDALAAMTVPAQWGDGGPSVDAGVLTSIAQACRDGEGLEFTYTTRDDERAVRHVEPHRLVLLGRRWYLVAWDLTRFDWRSFRLDRLGEPRSTGGHFPQRELPADDAAEFVRAGIDNLATRYEVEALVHAPAAFVRARIGRWGTVEHVDDDRCLLRMSADSLDWPMMALGVTGSDFEVIAPPALLDHVREWVDRFGRAALHGEPR
ncbi:MAG TPA: YafY family protein [Acidimicrobiales bacterium]|jgi:predicted DNA-binding transcriptional regulator YafY|nr:YafY family protein [Acidimicrobiales bacterium]